MDITIDPEAAAPPYEQLRVQVVALVDEGTLAPGTRLPTVRQLASDLGLAANTVARSYRELERAEVVETRGRRGTFVAAGRDRAAVEAAEAYAARLRDLGVTAEEGLRLARRALGRTGDA